MFAILLPGEREREIFAFFFSFPLLLALSGTKNSLSNPVFSLGSWHTRGKSGEGKEVLTSPETEVERLEAG